MNRFSSHDADRNILQIHRAENGVKNRVKTRFIAIALAMFSAIALPNLVQAQTEELQDIPSELAEVIGKIEEAANDQDLDRVMKYYGADFTNQDGLTTASVATALERTWETYPGLTYQTEILSWSQLGDELAAETLTTISGAKQEQGRTIRLKSELKTRQYFRDRKLVRQEILSEKTILTSGDRPPQVTVNVPETVKLGEKYSFDTIVEEPLEGNVLLGAVIEEKTASNLYLNPTSLELAPLTAGGIYKLVTAPRLADNHWLSAIVVRGDGITMVTQRVRVKE